MSTSHPVIILVHGSWVGAWSWSATAAELRRLGATVYTPALTGLGSRAAESQPSIGLQRHVEDVLACVDSIDAAAVTIVGHSYGSLVASEVAALRQKRVEALVIIDGLIAEADRSLFELVPEIEAFLMTFVNASAPDFIQPPPLDFLGLTPFDLQGVASPLTAMPTRTHMEAARFSPTSLICSCHYLGFTGFGLTEALVPRAEGLGWRARAMSGGHMSIIEQPTAVAEFILENR